MDAHDYENITSYNFIELSREFEYLKPFLRDNGSYVFSYEGQCALTRAILKQQFDIEFVESLAGNLCPPIPSKITYLRLINRVLMESDCIKNGNAIVKGVDIGTGAYAIYPLLGYKLFGWDMTGVDIDQTSITNAAKLLEVNQLNDYVKVLRNDGFLEDTFTFSMCNPPFFESEAEILDNESFKGLLNHEKVVATRNELITDGGETKFVSDLIERSQTLDIIWFSSMLGKKSSLDALIIKLKDIGCPNYLIKDYKLGRTKRWILFWSFKLYRPEVLSNYKNIQPTIIEFPINLEKVKPILSKYDLVLLDFKEDLIEVITNGDVWSRSFRRRKTKPDSKERSIFKITKDQIYWSYGASQKVFQSFHTMIRKQMNA